MRLAKHNTDSCVRCRASQRSDGRGSPTRPRVPLREASHNRLEPRKVREYRAVTVDQMIVIDSECESEASEPPTMPDAIRRPSRRIQGSGSERSHARSSRTTIRNVSCWRADFATPAPLGAVSRGVNAGGAAEFGSEALGWADEVVGILRRARQRSHSTICRMSFRKVLVPHVWRRGRRETVCIAARRPRRGHCCRL